MLRQDTLLRVILGSKESCGCLNVASVLFIFLVNRFAFIIKVLDCKEKLYGGLLGDVCSKLCVVQEGYMQ